MGNKKNSKKTKKGAKPASGKGKSVENISAKNPSRLRTSVMVCEAIASLQEKKGSSLQAIKKYLASNFHLDIAKHSTHIKKYIKSAVEKNELVQTKGTGVSGRFKLPTMADLKRERQKNMPKKPPSKKQAPVKPSSAATKKKDALKKKSGPNAKSSAKDNKKGGKSNARKMRQSSAPRNSKK